MRVAAILLSAWAVLRWVGFLLGAIRVRRFQGEARGEARRAVVFRFMTNSYLSVVPFYLWLSVSGRVPTPVLVGTVGGFLMFATVAGLTAAFMQPKERTPETLDLFRLIPNPWEAYEPGRLESDTHGHNAEG